ncbi:hypothetical protein M408DRAFT_103578 [Serendipita vermifera MAFF 305830]|uniref:Uncharacterized protein n=1 Tax=Serendipita vermifera MAFF 305830 TaxID=933852 RepID=A0A0C3AA41_SERVB|nr:hypothetical protein M408DRAFT_103578 [Serendipita vermifera MAFF 305830]
MREYEYRLYHRGGELARPLFGLAVPDTVQLANQILDTVSISLELTFRTLDASVAFELEKRYLNSSTQHCVVDMSIHYSEEQRAEIVYVREFRGSAPVV